MSLANAGGGGGLGAGTGILSTAAMAHGGPSAAHRNISKPTQHSQIPGGGASSYGTAAPGTSYAALGADLLDKNQSFISAKNVRAVSKLPIVAIDIYGDTTSTSYFPPLPKDESDGNEDEMEVMMKNMARLQKGVLVRTVQGTPTDDYYGTNVTLKKDDGDSYKAMKRYLNKGEGIGSVLRYALVTNDGGKSSNDDEDNVIVIERPHLLMGTRKLSDLNPAAKSTFHELLPSTSTQVDSPSLIDVVSNDITTNSSISLTTIALDGNSQQPKLDDYDRVVYQMKLNSKKKLMTILPEEALSLIIATCKKNVKDAYCLAEPESELNNYGLHEEEEDEDDESYMDYPPAFAIPGWATLDPTVEALIDAAKGSGGGGGSSSCGPSLHQRSIAACVGALLSSPTKSYMAKKSKANNGGWNSSNGAPSAPPASKLCNLLTETMTTKNTDAAKEAAKVAALNRTDPVEPDPFVPLVIMVGATKEGIELTAVQITKPQRPEDELHCPFGNISVISSVCYATANSKKKNDDDSASSSSMLESTLDELRKQIGIIVPESEEPTAFVTYGTTDVQTKLSTKLKATLKKYGKDGKNDDNWDGWDEDITILATKEECVSNGLAVLAASVHGRVRLIVSHKGTDGKMRPKAKIGVSVQDVATCAVAISYNYFGGNDEKWTTPKVIFDFDRRVPAGPYQVDLTAAECAAHVRHGTKEKVGGDACIEDVDKLLELASKLEGSKGIAEREAAALQLRFRIYQKTSRDGKWIRVGDDSRPLTMEHSQKDAGESGEDNLVALESTVLEISLSTVGIISTGLITNG